MKILFFGTALFSNILHCAESNLRSGSNSLLFAVIGNTRSESPYNSSKKRLTKSIKSINNDNPLFVIHLGNMICGGQEWQGVAERDVENQYKEVMSHFKLFKPIMYSVKGDTDLFNCSPQYYLKFTRSKEFYSFNYGNIHFLVLDLLDCGSDNSAAQLKWLKKDLELYKNSEAVFVFTHRSLYNHENTGIIDFKILHEEFKKYSVKAVFSGQPGVFRKKDIDGILYVEAVCGGYGHENTNRNYNYQYYLVEYINGNIRISGKNVSEK